MLDTNVCLDLFVFGDPRVAALAHALEQRRLQAFTDVHCRDEWRRVLAYPQWALSASAQALHLARFDAAVPMADTPSEDPHPAAALRMLQQPPDVFSTEAAPRHHRSSQFGEKVVRAAAAAEAEHQPCQCALQ